MMEIFDKFKGKKEVKRPNLIVFEKENVDNDYANFELKIKPRISIEEDFPQEAYELLAGRHKEILGLIEEIIFYNQFFILLFYCVSCVYDASLEQVLLL